MKAGDWVEVRPLHEILATLDSRASLEALPFMPEMVRYCGTRFTVWKSAHKTCDPTGATDMRRMKDAVHGEMRCSGEAHGGCEARCLIFWKEAWLKPAGHDAGAARAEAGAIGLLMEGARAPAFPDGSPRFRCQSTEIVPATTPLSPTRLNQYLDDIATGNASAAQVGARVSAAALTGMLKRLTPRRCPAAAEPAPAPASYEPLGLQPGELVEVRPAEDIMRTLNCDWKNRGLVFEREMLKYCGGQFRVLGRVRRQIDENTGRMLTFRNGCVILDGLYCTGLGKRSRLFCPRAPYYYWREDWLRRADPDACRRRVNA